MATVRIEVTQDDIERGDRNNCYACPVALSIKRAFEAVKHTAVRHGLISMYGCHKNMTATTPEAVQAFISAFDNNRAVEPFAFDLDIPDELLAPSLAPAREVIKGRMHLDA